MSDRTANPAAVLEVELAEKLSHRRREWGKDEVLTPGGRAPVPAPALYAEHAVWLMRRAAGVDV